MGFSDETYAAAKKYTDKTVAGAGGLAGVPCQIQSITPITGGNRVTFLWIDNNGDEHTSTMNVMNGVDGEDGEDGKGIQSVSVNADNHLIITYTDGTSADAGQIEIHSAVDSVNGQTGAVVLDAEDIGALPDDTPIPSKTSDLTNDSGFITKVVNDLVNYYLKSETYSKTEVDDIVTAIKNSRFEVVATLPTTDIKTNVIYLVPKSPSQTSNVKDEYINLDGTSAGWEKIGDTEIDLSDYVTTQALNTALANYTTTADLTTLLAAKQDTLTFDNAPTENSNNPVKSGGVFNSEQDIYKYNGVMGAKNLLENTGADTTTIRDVLFKKNVDGSVTANGTQDGTGGGSYYHVSDTFTVESGTYKLTGCPSGGSSTKYRVYVYDHTSGSTGEVANASDIGEGATFNLQSGHEYNINIMIGTSQTVNDLVFHPMIRYASDTDSTYQPYAKTNKELTEDSVDWDNFSELGAVNFFDNTAPDKSQNGAVYKLNADKSETISAATYPTTVSTNVSTYCKVTLPKGTYRLSGCPSGGSDNTYRLALTGIATSAIFEYGDGAVFTISEEKTGTLYFDARANWVITEPVTFYPMITPVSYKGSYVPYAKTNRELTEETDVTLTPDTSNFSIVSYKIKKRDGHVYGYIDAKVVNVSGVSVGTLSEKPSYTWAQAACNSTHRAADNTPTICYVNNQGVIAINPANVFVVDDRIQIAIDFYTSL